MTESNMFECVVTDNENNSYLVEMINTAKGSRSNRDYAKAAGISEAALSRILNGKYTPSAETIRKLTSDEAAPEGGVTYTDMMMAAGDKEMRLEKYCNSLFGYNDLRTRYITTVNGAVIQALMSQHMAFESIVGEDDTEYMSLKYADQEPLRIRVKDSTVTDWVFDIVDFSTAARTDAFERLYSYRLGIYMMLNPDKGRKISLVVNDEQVYQQMMQRPIAFRGNFSILLFDEKTSRIVDETYLSHFNEDDPCELYLVRTEG